MSIVYLVRKKVFRTAEGVKQLYYAVQRVLQRCGGVTAELLAQRMASRKGMSAGDVQSVLIDLPKFIEEALMEGESVTIKGLGSFHVAVTSDGFEHPDDVMPGKVRLSRVYFRPDKSLVARLNSGMDFYRYPLSDISLTICCGRKRCERSGPRERREFRMKTRLGWKMIRRTLWGRSER